MGTSGGKGCLLHSLDGALREPALWQEPYRPKEGSAEDRARLRFDNEPWHLWDLDSPTPVSGPNRVEQVYVDYVVEAINAIYGVRDLLYEVSPLVLPSLGLLHPL